MDRVRFENEVTFVLRVSNDTDKRKAINKVSDKLTSVRAYLNTGKDVNGQYNPIVNFDVQIFSAQSKAPTSVTTQITPGEYIKVRGNLSSKGYTTTDGRSFTNLIINASEISAPEKEVQAMPESTDVPAGFEPVSEENNPWNI